jgi:hypothetical protein
MSFYIGAIPNADLLGSETPRYFYALRRTDDGLLYFGKIDLLKDVDVIPVNEPGLTQNDFQDFEYGVDFFDGRQEIDHSRPYSNFYWDQLRWDNKQMYYYINDNGEFVIRVNQEYNLYPADFVGSIATKTANVTALVSDGITVTLTHATTTPFPIGAQITVSGITPNGYNGSYTVLGSTTQSVSFSSNVRTTYVSGGTITSTTLTVTEVNFGVLQPAHILFAATVTPGTKIVRQLGGVPGEVGVYVVDIDQTVTSTNIESRYE